MESNSNRIAIRLISEGKLIGFYRLDNGQKLLFPDELAEALKQAEQERQRAETLESLVARYREQFGELPET